MITGATSISRQLRGPIGLIRAAMTMVVVIHGVVPAAAAGSTHRFALVAGNDLGREPARALRFAEDDARKFHDVLRGLGGYPRANVKLMLGRSADEVWTALQRFEARIRQLRESSSDRALLVFYYAGHADGSVLELGPTTLEFDKVARFMRSSRANVRLAFVDSCQSGRLVRPRAARRGSAFRVRINNALESDGYAIITSSADDELSQETAEVRGSFFTHYLVSALRGAADESRDGKVTLAEAYRYVYSNTVARTSAHLGGGQHPMYDFRLKGRGGIALTQTQNSSSKLTVAAHTTGRLVVLDGHKRSMLAEARTVAGQEVTLALPPGEYEVFLLGAHVTYRAHAELAARGEARLAGAHFRRHKLAKAVARGGLFVPLWRSRVRAAALIRRSPLSPGHVSYGTALSYELLAPNGLRGTVELLWSTAADQGASRGLHALGALAGAGYRWRLAYLDLDCGAKAGYEQLLQAVREQTSRGSGSFLYAGTMGLALPLGGMAAHLDGAVGGRVLRLLGQGTTHRLDLQLMAGLSWTWTH